MKFNKKNLFYAIIVTISGSACGMQQTSYALYWNEKRHVGGNTNMHELITHMYQTEDNLDIFINTYNNALKEGGNPHIPNDKNHTAAQFLNACFTYKFFKAVDNDDRKQLNQLILSAPELCLESTHLIKDTPFEYAIKNNNLYAQAMISSYLRKGTFPQTYRQLIKLITHYL